MITNHARSCAELVPLAERPDAATSIGPYAKCGHPGTSARCTQSADGHDLLLLGRQPVLAGPYCTDHGGFERAMREAEADWRVLAPASVGDEHAVLNAGALALDSRAAYLVVRREPDEQRPRQWRVRCSAETARAVGRVVGAAVGRALAPQVWHGPEDVAHARADRIAELVGARPSIDVREGAVVARRRPWVAALGLGGYTQHVGAYPTRSEALEHGTEAWRVWVALAVHAIREARGGTLAWGVAIEPLDAPVLVEPACGQSAWDAVAEEASAQA